LPPVTQRTFFQNIHQHVTVREQQKKVDEKRVRVFVGIKIKLEEENEEEGEKPQEEQPQVDKQQKLTTPAQDAQDAQDSIPKGNTDATTTVIDKDIGNPCMLCKLCTPLASDFVLCEVVGCKRLDLTQYGVCSYCKRSPVELTHIVRTFKHSGLFVCEDCASQIKKHLRGLMDGDG